MICFTFSILYFAAHSPIRKNEKKKTKCRICDWNSKFSMFQFVCRLFGKMFCVHSFSLLIWRALLFCVFLSVYAMILVLLMMVWLSKTHGIDIILSNS